MNDFKYTEVAKFARALKLALDSEMNQFASADLQEVLRALFSVESGNRKLAFRGGALSKTVYETCFHTKTNVGSKRRELFTATMDATYPELHKIICTDPKDPRK
jgi:hypothetical protein